MQRSTPVKSSQHFHAVLEKSDNRLWGAHVVVPRALMKQFPDVDARRVICTLNGTERYQTAILPYDGDAWVIRVNKTLMRKLKLAIGTDVHIELQADTSEYGLPMPEELEALLEQDPEGSELFHALTRGKQRTLLYIAGGVKDSAKRIDRAVVILRHLKSNGGKIDFRKLADALKDPRR